MLKGTSSSQVWESSVAMSDSQVMTYYFTYSVMLAGQKVDCDTEMFRTSPAGAPQLPSPGSAPAPGQLLTNAQLNIPVNPSNTIPGFGGFGNQVFSNSVKPASVVDGQNPLQFDIQCPAIEFTKQVVSKGSGVFNFVFNAVKSLSAVPLTSIEMVEIHILKETEQANLRMGRTSALTYEISVPLLQSSQISYFFTYIPNIGSSITACDSPLFSLSLRDVPSA